MSHRESQAFTPYGWIVCVWILISAFQYGFHISALNQIEAVISCRQSKGIVEYYHGLPTCIPMNDTQFSVVTSAFTIGGLVGSLAGNPLTDKRGRRGALRINAGLIAAGAFLVTVSTAISPLVLGRFLIGVGAGIGICVGPIYIGEIAPHGIRGSVGVLTQMSIVSGILVTQAMGMRFATPHDWRFVTFFSTLLSVFQIFVSPFVSESPAWLTGNGYGHEAEVVSKRLWGPFSAIEEDLRTADYSEISTEDYERSLLSDAPEADVRPPLTRNRKPLTMIQLIQSQDMRIPLLIVSFAMAGQQFSGINAVLYYSNNILSKTLPDFAPYVSLGITVVNAIMTVPPIFLIEKMGRKSLLYISIVGSFISLLLVAFGLNSGMKVLSSFAIIFFVASFAAGLGPIPFVIISDVSPYHAVSALSSAALSLNWIANFIVGLIFLPLRNFLSGGDASKEGRVFYLFASALAFFSLALSYVYKN